MLSRYLANMKMIDLVGSGFGVSTFHVFQPIFKYKHRPSCNPFERDAGLSGIGTRRKDFHTTAYERMNELVSTYPPSPGFVWAADLNEAENGIMYVDRLHYAPVMSDRLAGFIARHIVDVLNSARPETRGPMPSGLSMEAVKEPMRASKGSDS